MKLWSFIWPAPGTPWVSARVAAPTRHAAEALLPTEADAYGPRVIVQYMGEIGACSEGVVSMVARAECAERSSSEAVAFGAGQTP